MMRVAAPKGPLREIGIEGYNCHAAFDRPTEQLLIGTTLEFGLRGVDNLMAVVAQGLGNFDPNVLIEEYPVHQSRRAESSVDSTDSLANSTAARMSSSERAGNPLRICANDSPAASWLNTEVTNMRVPRMTGFPLQMAGSISMRSWYVMGFGTSPLVYNRCDADSHINRTKLEKALAAQGLLQAQNV